jgi:hydroxymethylpyrimidine kinase/phosphomethylpyrimidine kinase
VLDPVVQPSAGGPELLDASGVKYLTEELMKRASVVTPNLAEAKLLTGLEIKDVAGMEAAGRKLVERGARAVVVKGGHMDKAVDVLVDGAEVFILGGEHVKNDNTHGSGCTFASAIAAHLASGHRLREATVLAKAYVTKAIEHGFAIGKGAGPLDHFYRSHSEPPARGIHEVPQHGMHPASDPASR